MPARRVLPLRRAVQTFDLHHAEQSYQVSVGYFDDLTPDPTLAPLTKTSAGVEAIARDAAVLLSIAMQFGVPLDVLHVLPQHLALLRGPLGLRFGASLFANEGV